MVVKLKQFDEHFMTIKIHLKLKHIVIIHVYNVNYKKNKK